MIIISSLVVDNRFIRCAGHYFAISPWRRAENDFPGVNIRVFRTVYELSNTSPTVFTLRVKGCTGVFKPCLHSSKCNGMVKTCTSCNTMNSIVFVEDTPSEGFNFQQPPFAPCRLLLIIRQRLEYYDFTYAQYFDEAFFNSIHYH